MSVVQSCSKCMHAYRICFRLNLKVETHDQSMMQISTDTFHE